MWTNCPVAVLALAPVEQTEASAIPLRSLPKTFFVAVSSHEVGDNDGSELVQPEKVESS